MCAANSIFINAPTSKKDFVAKLQATPYYKTDSEKPMKEHLANYRAVSKQPALLMRRMECVPINRWKYQRFLNKTIVTKEQRLKVTKGLGGKNNLLLDERQSKTEMTIMELKDISEKSNWSDSEAFRNNNKREIIYYINDLHVTDKDMELKNDAWVFEDLNMENMPEVSGVNTPWAYVGTTGSKFGVHLEDSNIGGVNTLWEGAEKIWFCCDQREQFQNALETLYPVQYEGCWTYHRHKQFWVDPNMMAEKFGLTIYKIIQKPGDTVVVWPGTWHWGFNRGFNCSMAVNYFPLNPKDVKMVLGAQQCKMSCESPTLFMNLQKLVPQEKFKCAQKKCGKEFCTKQGMKKHLLSLHKIPMKQVDSEIMDVKVKCFFCDKECSKMSDHQQLECDVMNVSFTCTLCRLQVPNARQGLKDHFKICKVCMGCRDVFTNYEDALDHICNQ